MSAEVMMFFDPLSLLLVIAASIIIAWVQNGAAAMHRAFGIFPAIWAHQADDVAESARLAMIRVEQRVEQNGPNHADRIAPDIPFIAELAEMLANAPDRKNFSESVKSYRNRHRQKREAAIGFWGDMAEVAPAIGMIGTVVGLILMFDGIDSAEAIGEAMAVCLLTSLYGLLLAHIVAGPIARRIELFSKREQLWQDDFARRFMILAAAQLNDRDVIVELADWAGPASLHTRARPKKASEKVVK